MRLKLALAVALGAPLTAALLPPANAQPAWQFRPQPGDCVLYREGGDGLIFTAPVYWLRGTILAIVREQRRLAVCPTIGKPKSAYTPADWAMLVAASPCVDRPASSPPAALPAPAGEVAVTRAQLVVDDWETPWSHQHGNTGWLFRGQFLAQPLQRGKVIEMDTSWLVPCEAHE